MQDESFVLSCCSTVDLTNDWVNKRNIRYIRFNASVDGKPYKDDMGLTLNPWDLYEKMEKGAVVKTSMVSIGEYLDYFREFLKAGKDILHVSMSTGISGTYNAACQARDQLQEEYPERKIVVLDSLSASSGYGMLMDTLADLRDQGKSLDEIAAWTEENKLRLNHWFFSNDLTYYIRGGRVSRTAGLIGQVLNICPLLNVDSRGRLIPREKVRTKKKVEKRIVEKMVQYADNGTEYDGKCFMCTSDYEASDRVKELVEQTFPHLKGKVHVFDIGCTIGTHTGPGTVALFFYGKPRED